MKNPKKRRIPIPADVSARVLFDSDRTCCVCREKGKSVQIHHVDDDPSNNDFGNLAVLCLDCHRDTQISGGFDRKLDAEQVRLYREHWLEVVVNYRTVAPHRKLGESRSESLLLKTTAARLEISKEKEDWFEVACTYDEIGDPELRDKYVERSITEGAPPWKVLYLRSMQGRLDEVPEDMVQEVLDEERGDDWTSYARTLIDLDRIPEAALALLDGIQNCVNRGQWFSAAFYLKYWLSAPVFEPLFKMALHQAIEEDDLWWQMRAYEELGWDDAKRELLLGNETRIREEQPSLILLQKLAAAKGDDEEYLELSKQIEEVGRVQAWTGVDDDDEEGSG